MSDNVSNEPILDAYIFETNMLLEQLEQIIIGSEQAGAFAEEATNEIFRIMHTIKGSSAMMFFSGISALAHAVEDLFDFLRKEKPQNIDFSTLCDTVLESVDFIKSEMPKIENGEVPKEAPSELIGEIKGLLGRLKNQGGAGAGDGKAIKRGFKAVVYFEDGCAMENIRAFSIIHNLSEIADEINYIPEDIADNPASAETIKKEGFQIWFKTECSFDEMHGFFSRVLFLKDLELVELGDGSARFDGKTQAASSKPSEQDKQSGKKAAEGDALSSSHKSMISVSVSKLDKLMDLVGELVISEAMLTQNPDLAGLALENFQKAARQHHKIINELQDIAMSIRMVPLSPTFQKMNRVVRDMSKKLSKDVRLQIIGEETEVDKNIIEHISDPLIHLIRNSIDHGVEPAEVRKAKGKSETATISLEAKTAGGDVLIIVRDDGAGLDKEKILARARANGLVSDGRELTDKEIYSLIFLPGFSTKDKVTEFSGRGVGMDVVSKNIAAVGGTVSVDSVPGKGTSVTMKIPLTLAIMEGLMIKVGNSTYTVPVKSVRESFKAREGDLVYDPDGNEMIIIRGKCYPIMRLHKLHNVKTDITDITDGVIITAEDEGKGICIFADKLLGKQQVVVKPLPNYISNIGKVRGLAGCTLLGDGSISLILSIAGLLESQKARERR